MKTVKMILTALIFSTVSLSCLAATETTMPHGLTRIGRVTDSSGAGTLSDLQSNLAAKADAAGARYYRIIAAGGNNSYSGAADIYK